ncbi:hypothetical protein JDS79_32680, partial [Bacillus cereus]|nr:hypothetical protein [Bacillus cereus]
DEWNALLPWREAAFPQYADSGAVTDAVEEEVSEVELARRHARFKQEQDAGYGNKLLRMAMDEPLSEQTILALEQLSYLELPEIDDALLRWITEREIHPLLQFRVLQTMRRRGTEGTIEIRRGDEQAEIDIETVPVQPGDFPESIMRILE